LAEFDFKKLKSSELVMLGGALAVFIGTFLTWYKAEAKGLGFSASDTVNGFHYFLQGTIPWILAIAIAAAIIIRTFFPDVKLPDPLGPVSWAQGYLIAAGLAAVLILSRLIFGESGNDFVDVTRGIGMYLSSLGGIALAVGAYLKFQANEEAGTASGPPTAF